MQINNQESASLVQIADRLVKETEILAQKTKTEEDLRIGFEKILTPLLLELGIKSDPKYERLGADAAVAYKGRPDAVHGLIIIEYEKPGAFNSVKWVEHAHQQLVEYITAEATSTKATLFIEDPKYVGVGFDGTKIFFTKYKGNKTSLKSEINSKDFVYDGPYNLDVESARTLLTYLRSLSRKPLTAEHLAEAFGPQGTLAPLAVSAFADSLEYWGKDRVRVFFNEWKRLFGIVYGEQFNTSKNEETKALSELYKVGHETDFQELLFSVHTYFALLMKFIVAELLTLKETAFNSSYSYKLTHLSKEELVKELVDIEEGGIYSKRGISNFLEGDFFRWYLDAWSPRLEEAIREMARLLSEFEPATSVINPEATRDLLKKLYQYLVPQEVRHKLGEYYTPDWLAELLLTEIDYKGDSLKRFLDPACGSGTFLVLAIRKIREHAKSQRESPLETAKRIVANVWGFDLNPLAIIATRTNYLFALGDLAEKLHNIEIPIYLADSVLWPQRSGQLDLAARGENVNIQTSVGLFHVPKVWIEGKGFLMRKAAPLLEEMVKAGYESSEAIKRFQNEGLVFPPHEEVIQGFYNEILDLEKQNKNGIWARFLKNAFAPMVAEKFDYVIGNPPWIMWQYHSKEYREATTPLWENYGLTRIAESRNVLVRGRRDFSMLFTYASADYYLKESGKLGFLITQEVFKSKGGGDGFRRFRLGDRTHLKVIKALDLATVQPFEGALNKTAAIILKKGEKTTYPIPYFVYSRKNGVGRVSPDILLKEAKMYLDKKELVATPIGKETGSWQTIKEDQVSLKNVGGKNFYKAYRGTAIDPYGVFWLKVKQVLSNGDILVENMVERSRTEIQKVQETIEQDLVYPGITGSDIQRWKAVPSVNVLVTHPSEQKPYSEQTMKQKWPKTYNYLLFFKDVLVNRGVYKHFHERSGNPFYGQRNFGEYTYLPYKVSWKRMSNDLVSAVVSQQKTDFGYKDIMPLDTVAFFSTKNEEEAHYLCAIINSEVVRDYIKSYSSAGRGFGAPSVMDTIGVSKFDFNNKIHSELSDLSKKLHEIKASGKEEEIPAFEKKVDEVVKRLFGIN
ncbi:MAG: N-6 DNA methylase [Patescibacteria group bacterium]